jgi:hypothetical protein
VDAGTAGTTITNTVSNVTLDQTDSNATADDLSESVKVSVSLAGSTVIPDTGQITSYSGIFGEDSDYDTNPPSYTKLDDLGNPLPDIAVSWAMVRDNITGLIWEVKQSPDGVPDYANLHDIDNKYWWYDSNPATNGGVAGTDGAGDDTEDFINALNASNFGGYSDWRVPTAKELASIMNSDATSPAINTQYFPNTLSSGGFGMYWTSTTEVANPQRAFLGYFHSGIIACNFLKVSVLPTDPPPEQALVRAVRGTWYTNNFIDNGDGTITDSDTGLMWEKNPSPSQRYWDDAINYCENLTLAGYSDWRLPNRNELQSIVDYKTYNPAINTTFFPGTQVNYYSSTTCIYFDGSGSEAWRISFYDGDITEVVKNSGSQWYVRCTR